VLQTGQLATVQVGPVAPPRPAEQPDEPVYQTVALVGNAAGMERIRFWLTEHQRHNPKLHRALLIYGPPGCGKATAARNILHEMGYDVQEFSTLERRESADLDLVASAAGGRRYQDKPAAVLITDVEHLSVSKQKSAIARLRDIICPWRCGGALGKAWQAPILCISNQLDSPAMHGVSAACDTVEFQALSEAECGQLVDASILTLEPDQRDRLIKGCRGNAVLLQSQLGLLSLDKQCGLPLGSIASADVFCSVQQSLAQLLTEPTWEHAQRAHNQAVSLVPLLLHDNLPRCNSLETAAEMLEWFSMSDVIEEQGLVNIRPDLRDMHTVMAVWGPAHQSRISPDTLQYPEYRSYKARLRNGRYAHMALARAVGGDAVWRNEVAGLVAQRVMAQSVDANVVMLTGMQLRWPSVDYCLARCVDMQYTAQPRQVKKRCLSRATLVTLRRALEQAWEKADSAEDGVVRKYALVDGKLFQ